MIDPEKMYAEVMGALQEAVKGRAAAERSVNICSKKFELACIEQDEKAIEATRLDLMSAFEATLDLSIKIYKTSAHLNKKYQI